MFLNDLNEKKESILELKQCLEVLDISISSIFTISQDYYGFLKRTISANGNICQIIKPQTFRDAQNLYQDKTSRDMALNEFKLLTSSCWDEKYQPLTINMTKDKCIGRFRSRLNSLFIPNTNPL